MRTKYKLFTECNSDAIMGRAKTAGFACLIAMQSKVYFAFRLVDFKAWLMPAVDHKQIMLFFDYFGDPKGYIIWANLAPDSELRVLNDPGFILHESEWDEGNSTWILDCCFPFGDLAHAIPEIRRVFKEQEIEQITWARRNENYSIKKIVKVSI